MMDMNMMQKCRSRYLRAVRVGLTLVYVNPSGPARESVPRSTSNISK